MSTTKTWSPERVAQIDLMARAQRGEQATFEELVTRYSGRVNALCCRMIGNADVAKELTQEAFTRAWENRHTFKPGHSVDPLLFRIARNLCIDRFRKHGKELRFGSLSQPWRDEEGTEVTGVDPPVDEDDNDPAMIALWNDWYESLSPEEKTLADLYQGRGDSRMEVIEKMETHRDVRECRKRLDEREELIIKRRYDEGKTLQQVANEIGVTIQAVWQKEQRALEKLCECMRGKGYHIDDKEAD